MNSVARLASIQGLRTLIAETGQNSACNRHHPLEKRLFRWLLSSLDRLRSN